MAEQGQRMKRKWHRLGMVDETGEPLEEHVREVARQMLLDIEATGHNLGGAFLIAPLRVRMVNEDGSERYAIAGWTAEWTQYVPALEESEFRMLHGLPRIPEMLDTEPQPQEPEVVPDDEQVPVGLSE